MLKCRPQRATLRLAKENRRKFLLGVAGLVHIRRLAHALDDIILDGDALLSMNIHWMRCVAANAGTRTSLNRQHPVLELVQESVLTPNPPPLSR